MPYFGMTDAETVMRDFDNTPFRTVKYWAHRAMKWHRLGGFLILESSKDNHHAVFNRKVNWSENTRLRAWVALLSNKPKLQRWHLMQDIKQGSTLRIGPKGEKPSPRIVYREGDQDEQNWEFLEFRRLIKGIMRRLKAEGYW